MDLFSFNVLIAGFLVALISAPMGCLIQWHRMAFLADTLGHSAILGVAIALMMKMDMYYGVALVSVVIVIIIVQTQKRQQMPSESVLAIISQAGLASGLLLMSYKIANDTKMLASQYSGLAHTPQPVVNEHDFKHTAHELLFGDIQSVTMTDVFALLSVSLVILVILAFTWKKLLLISMSWEISQAEGLSVNKYNLIMYLLMALMVSVLVKVMGILLIASLLVIPPTAVRWFSVSPEKMVIFAFVFSLLSVVMGFVLSAYWTDLTAPSIVMAAVIGLLISQFVKKVQNSH